jgi:hypothetical protein
MVFSEDSYNKVDAKRTLIGNWHEEAVLKETCGEARSLPQRHIKRAGLLTDFTKQASEVKKLDNTFERVCGSATLAENISDRWQTSNQAHAASSVSKQKETLPPRKAMAEEEFLAAALKAQKEQQEALLKIEDKRVSEYKQAMNLKVKAATSAKEKEEVGGLLFRGKYTEFSHPIELQQRGGRFKDESGVRPEPKKIVMTSKEIPSLNGLKEQLRKAIEAKGGLTGLSADELGLVSVAEVKATIGSILGEEGKELVERYGQYAETQLATMVKGKVSVSRVLADINN